MKKEIFLLLALLPGILPAQVSDDFSDGDFAYNPEWTGNTEQFEINSSFQLHLNASGNDTSSLSTPIATFRDTEWNFWIKLSFNTSTNNHARINLISDHPDPEVSQNSYYLQLGGSNDSILFCRQNGATSIPLLHVKQFSTDHSVNQFRFKVKCEEMADWSIFADSAGNESFIKVGTVHDEMELQEGYFGIRCRYTASNATKIYFDDLYAGPLIRDTIEPFIASLNVLSQTRIQVTWSESPDMTVASDTANYLLKLSGQHPFTAEPDPDDPLTTLLTFAFPLTDPGCDSLSANGVKDLVGNMMKDTTLEICYYRAKAYDVLIHEIMADPEPANTLPPSEFIELFNRSGHGIQLENWSIHYGSASTTFPANTIPPDEYMLISKDSLLSKYGTTLSLFSGTSVLSNEGTTLVLKDDSGRIIHSVTYTHEWFEGSFKEDGGWSLEMKDPENPCGCLENWAASTDPSGGTPGRANSIACPVPDLLPPEAWRGMIHDSFHATVVFSECLDSTSFQDLSMFKLEPGQFFPWSIEGIPPDYRSVLVTFAAPLDTGMIYTLNIQEGFRDCAGNQNSEDVELILAFPVTPTPGNIIINEILTDPCADGSRFIELYNRGDHPVDLRDLLLSHNRAGKEDPPDIVPLTDDPWLLLPGRYAAVCRDCEDVMDRYPGNSPEHFLQMEELPAFSSEDGIVRLIRRSDEKSIDMLSYSITMHDPLLSITEGVSLERIDPYRPSSDSTNWHSAAYTSGYATPGAENSQYFIGKADDGTLRIEPSVFSPDNDGRDDVLSITCIPGGPGMKATVCIYDSRGMLVRQLANTILSEPQFTITWDGTTDFRLRAPSGIYIIFLRVTDNSGNTRTYKRTAVLATQF